MSYHHIETHQSAVEPDTATFNNNNHPHLHHPELRSKGSRRSEHPRPASQHSYQETRDKHTTSRPEHSTNNNNLISTHSGIPGHQPSDVFRRSNKIISLQQEFEELKKKIKQVENKNERIIEKIQTNKGVPLKKAPVSCQPESLDVDLENSQAYSQIDEYQFRSNNLPPHPTMARQFAKSRVVDTPHSEVAHRKIERQSSQHNKSQQKSPINSKNISNSNVINHHTFEDEDQNIDSRINYVQHPQTPARESKQSHHSYDQRNSSSHKKNSEEKEQLSLMQVLQREKISKERLLYQLSQKQELIKKCEFKYQTLKTSFRNYSENMKQVFQNSLDDYFEEQKRLMAGITQKVSRNKEKLDQLGQRLNNLKKQKQQNRVSAFSKKKEGSRNKTDQLEGLVNKYDQLIKTKNEETETWAVKYRVKEKEVADMKLQLEKIKDSRKKLELESEDRIMKLEGKIKELTEHNRRQTADLERQRARNSLRDSGENFNTNAFQEAIFASNREANELLIKVNSYDKALAEKNKLIMTLEKEVSSFKANKTQMLKEYQEAIEKTRSIYKQRIDQLTIDIEECKRTVNQKSAKILTLEQNLRKIQSAQTEAKTELRMVQQKLRLKEEVWNKKNKEGELNQKQSIQITDLESAITALRQEVEKWQTNYSQQKSLLKKKERLLEDYEQDNSNLRKQIDQLRSSFDSPRLLSEGEMGNQDNLLLKKESSLLKSRLSVASEENTILKMKMLSLENEAKYLEELNTDNQNKIRQFQVRLQQVQLSLKEKQRELDQKGQQIQTLKDRNACELDILSQQLKTLQDEFNSKIILLRDTTDELNNKSAENKFIAEELQMLKNRLSDYEQIRNENEKLQLRLADTEEELMARSNKTNRMNEDFRKNMNSLKSDMDLLVLDKIRLEEENKFMKTKIEELQMEVFAQNLPENSGSNQEPSITGKENDLQAAQKDSLLQRLKNLEQTVVSLEVTKAQQQLQIKKLEVQLQESANENKSISKILQQRNNEFAKMMMNYDEKLQEQEIFIRQFEKSRDDDVNRILNTRKSQIRSQSSLMFSATSQIYNDPMNHKSRISTGEREIDFHLSEEGSQFGFGEPNVEQLFEKLDYPYEKIRLRRKDQAQLLSKTAEYINSLKKTINQKNRKIRALEKKIQGLKNGGSTNTTNTLEDWEDQQDQLSDFKDNYSVKLDERRFEKTRGEDRRRLRQLQNETHLVMEENNLLLQKVDSLQQELNHAEEQENGLIRMKEIYKEEIVKLRKTLDEREQKYKAEVQRLNHIIQESEGCHNTNTLKQLTAKIFNIIFNDEKRDEKRKELEEYVKVLVSILKIQNPIKHDFKYRK